eukprot:3963077-Amphidinium_carterae.2
MGSFRQVQTSSDVVRSAGWRSEVDDLTDKRFAQLWCHTAVCVACMQRCAFGSSATVTSHASTLLQSLQPVSIDAQSRVCNWDVLEAHCHNDH